jgi:hypothetical protein
MGVINIVDNNNNMSLYKSKLLEGLSNIKRYFK